MKITPIEKTESGEQPYCIECFESELELIKNLRIDIEAFDSLQKDVDPDGKVFYWFQHIFE